MVDRDQPLLLRKVDALRQLAISAPYLDALIRRGDIGIVKFGRRATRIPASEITRLIAERLVVRGGRS